jgi:hypothetical protein
MRSFRAVECDTDHYLVVAEVKERLAMNRQRWFHAERFSLKKLNEVESKGKYCIEVSNRFAAWEELETEVEISNVGETIIENVKRSTKVSLGLYELRKCEPWFNERC